MTKTPAAPTEETDASPPPQAPIALTMGEPAGCGTELTLRSWLTLREAACAFAPPFFVIADTACLARAARALGLDVPIAAIAHPEEAPGVFARALPVLPVALTPPVVPGRLNAAHQKYVFESLERAVGYALRGEASAVATNPIHKKALYDHGFPFPGHTEYLEARCGGRAVMMLVEGSLRLLPVTLHCPLGEVPARLTVEAIVAAGVTARNTCAGDFGIGEARIAVAALNPHAGEDGALGREEIEVIAPAVAELRRRGVRAYGPFAADSLLSATYKNYDAVLCMYHDQALTAFKLLGRGEGVNVTAGIGIVRTSPAHGTALAIAGRGVARPGSLIAALRLAAALARRRGIRHDGNGAVMTAMTA